MAEVGNTVLSVIFSDVTTISEVVRADEINTVGKISDVA